MQVAAQVCNTAVDYGDWYPHIVKRLQIKQFPGNILSKSSPQCTWDMCWKSVLMNHPETSGGFIPFSAVDFTSTP